MAGNWLWAAAHLEFAELIAGKNKEELDVVKEEIHLRQAAASERSRRGAGALQSYRPYRVRQERKGQPQEADARRPGARRLLQRLQLAGGSMREGAAATWGTVLYLINRPSLKNLRDRNAVASSCLKSSVCSASAAPHVRRRKMLVAAATQATSRTEEGGNHAENRPENAQ